LNKHFFIPLVPTKAETRKRGAATHFAKKKGIVEFRWDLALYIASEIGSGIAEPKLFICAWYDPKTEQINVGFDIPRTQQSYAAKSPSSLDSRFRSSGKNQNNSHPTSAPPSTLERFYKEDSSSTEGSE